MVMTMMMVMVMVRRRRRRRWRGQRAQARLLGHPKFHTGSHRSPPYPQNELFEMTVLAIKV